MGSYRDSFPLWERSRITHFVKEIFHLFTFNNLKSTIENSKLLSLLMYNIAVKSSIHYEQIKT